MESIGKLKLIEIFEPDLIIELEQCPVNQFDPKITLLQAGCHIKFVPLILSGSINVVSSDESGKEILLYYIQPIESCILSITSVLNNNFSRVNAYTDSASKIILINADLVRLWMDKYVSWRKFVMKLYDERLLELLTLVDAVAFKHIDNRLIEKLKEKANPKGEIYITHQKLANELGTAREVVSRLLKELERRKKIKISRGLIKLVEIV